MVRILLCAVFCISIAAAAHGADDSLECERDLVAEDLHRIRTLRYVNKLSAEIDQIFPNYEYYRVGLGKSTAPLMAGLQNLGTQATYLPLKVDDHWHGPLVPHSESESRFNRTMGAFFPEEDELNGKNILLVVYTDNAQPLIAIKAQLERYLAKNWISPRSLHILCLTSQLHKKEVVDALTKSFGTLDRVTIRPIALANEARRWMKDLDSGEIPSVSPYPSVDVFAGKPFEIVRQERDAYIRMKAELRRVSL